MATDCGQGKEATIKSLVDEQVNLLGQLNHAIDNLVERNPKPECGTSELAQQPDNVFDEVISELQHCRGLIRSAAEKVEMGIANKVH